jgi:hypothetical protein
MTLPRLDERPRAKVTESYSLEEMMRLSIIPEEDAELRAAAARLLALGTIGANAVGGACTEAYRAMGDAQMALHQTAATTPGGIAFQLLEVLDVMQNDAGEDWTHDRYMVQSAAEDLIEPERVRLAAFPRR